jgi:hypothetical protein
MLLPELMDGAGDDAELAALAERAWRATARAERLTAAAPRASGLTARKAAARRLRAALAWDSAADAWEDLALSCSGGFGERVRDAAEEAREGFLAALEGLRDVL